MYDLLFSPFKLGNVELKNRLLVTAMVTNYCNYDGTLTEKWIRYDRIPGFYSDDQIAMNRIFTERIHKYGTKVICQLYHPGRQSNQYVNGGVQPIAPSAIPCPWLKQIPHELTVDEIKEIVGLFGDAALRAKKSGFDGVELHLAHGYLLFEFLSPHVNKRTDEYGGCFKNRVRIVKEIYEDMRSKVGDDFLITTRFSAWDGYQGGRTEYDSMELAMYLEDLGFQAFNVTFGSYGDHNSYERDVQAHAFVADACEKIKSVVKIPVYCTNRVTTAGVAEAVLRSGKADLIGMGRTSLADPHFPNKAREGKEETVRHCINCNLGCYGSLLSGGTCTCLVNPTVGREDEIDAWTEVPRKKVFVAGGGPGGVWAALTANARGHEVVIFDEKDRLGGMFISASYPPEKGELSLFTSWMNQEVKAKGIETRFGTRLTKEIVEEEKPDTVIVAAGGRPLTPPIPGINGANVYHAEDVLLGKVPTGANVVVCGGGEVGVETAAAMAFRLNGKVTIVEMLPNIFASLDFDKLITEYKIDVKTETKATEIKEDRVVVEKDGVKSEIPATQVVLAFGYKPDNSLAEELKGLCDVKVIGGSVKTSNAVDATRDGFNAGMAV